MSSAWFQLPVHNAAPPSLHGVRKGRSPASPLLWDAATPCRPSRRASFPSLGDTIVPSHLFVPASLGRRLRINLELVSRYLRPAATMETTGSPKFPGSPGDHSPCSSDPGVTRHADGSRCRSCLPRPPRLTTTNAHDDGISGLNHTAFDLAVYASSWRSPDTTQDSLPAAGPALPDGIGYPQGFNERFHIVR